MFACLDEEEMDIRSEEIPESGANSAYRHINLENVMGAMTGDGGTGKRNVLASPTQDLMEEDCASSLG